jgi:hypothetical protein
MRLLWPAYHSRTHPLDPVLPLDRGFFFKQMLPRLANKELPEPNTVLLYMSLWIRPPGMGF